MSGHTPGPWTVVNEEERDCIRDLTGVEPSDWADIRHEGHTIGSAYCGNSFEQNMANARLMSAAPDMLAALKEISRNAALSDAWLDPVRAAIAKAEGKS